MTTVCTIATILAAAILAACTTEKTSADKSAGNVPTTAASEGGTQTGGGAGDVDVAAAGTGLPVGYAGRTDKPDAKLTDATYATRGSAWEVTTGPAHIIYAAKDSVRGNYTVTTTIDQLQAPRHPEGYGLFVGGQGLDGAAQKYTYFLVRGGGEFLVKVRDGTATRDVTAWKSAPAVPKADASGKASYTLTVKAAADSLHFLVNGAQVAATARAAVPADGVAGLRINHNLHVRVRPISITRG